HHREPLAVLAGAHRLDGSVQGEHVGLVGEVLHGLRDAADLLRALRELGDLLRDLVHLRPDLGETPQRLLDGRLSLGGDLIRLLGQLEHRLRLLRREQRGLLDLLGGDLRLLQCGGLPRDGLALIVGALAQLATGAGATEAASTSAASVIGTSRFCACSTMALPAGGSRPTWTVAPVITGAGTSM